MGCCSSSRQVTITNELTNCRFAPASSDLLTLYSKIRKEFPELQCHAFYLVSADDQIINSQKKYSAYLKTRHKSKFSVVKEKPHSFQLEDWNKKSLSVFKLRRKNYELAGTGFLVSPRFAITTMDNFTDQKSLKNYSALFQDSLNTEVQIRSEGVFLQFPDEEGIKFALVELAPSPSQHDFLGSLVPIKLNTEFKAQPNSQATVIFYTRNHPVLQAETAPVNVFDNKFFDLQTALKEGSSGAPVLNSNFELIGVFSSYKSDEMPGSGLRVNFIVEKLKEAFDSNQSKTKEALQEIWNFSGLPIQENQANGFLNYTCYLDTSKQYLWYFGAESETASNILGLPTMKEGSSAVCTPWGILMTGPPQSAWLFDGEVFIKCENMLQEHLWHCSAYWKECVYVIGGQNSKSVEVFSFQNQKWNLSAQLPHEVARGSCVASDTIYLLGGHTLTDFSEKILALREGYWEVLEVRLPNPSIHLGIIKLSTQEFLVFGGTILNSDLEVEDNLLAWSVDVASSKLEQNRKIQKPLKFGSYNSASTDQEAVIYANSGELLRYSYKIKRIFFSYM